MARMNNAIEMAPECGIRYEDNIFMRQTGLPI